MSLQTYYYSGPVSGATLVHNGKVLDVRLHPGKPVQLPPDHDYTQVLLGLQYLRPVEVEQTDATPDGNPRRNKKEDV